MMCLWRKAAGAPDVSAFHFAAFKQSRPHCVRQVSSLAAPFGVGVWPNSLVLPWARLPFFRQPEKHYCHYAALRLSFLAAVYDPDLASLASVQVAIEPAPLVTVEAQHAHCSAPRAAYVSAEGVVLHPASAEKPRLPEIEDST